MSYLLRYIGPASECYYKLNICDFNMSTLSTNTNAEDGVVKRRVSKQVVKVFLSSNHHQLQRTYGWRRLGRPQAGVLRHVSRLDQVLPLPGMVHFHTCQVLRLGHSHYGFLDKLKTTGVVGKDYGFMLFWRCNFFGNHL